jgi:hypothetical protein
LDAWTDEQRVALADLGYEGENDRLVCPVKKPSKTGGAELSVDQRAFNMLHSATRALAERGNSLLKTTFKAPGEHDLIAVDRPSRNTRGGISTVGVQRQYTGNCRDESKRPGRVYFAYASGLGHAPWRSLRGAHRGFGARPVPACAQHTQQGVTHGDPRPRVERDQWDVVTDGERPTDVVEIMREHAVKDVDSDHEWEADLLEEVNGGIAIVQAPGVDDDQRAESTLDQVVPHEREPILARGAEQVQLDLFVDGDAAEIQGDGGRGLPRNLSCAVDLGGDRRHCSFGR